MTVEIHVHVDKKDQVSIRRLPVSAARRLRPQEQSRVENIEELMINSWWSRHMHRPFAEGLQTWQSLIGAQDAARSGQSVELVSAEMVYDESRLKLLRAFQAARGSHLKTQKVVEKLIAEGLKIAELRSIDENIVKSFIEDSIDILAEAWSGERGISGKKISELKSSVFQSELPLAI